MTAAPQQSSGVELLPCPFCGASDEKLVQGFVRATDTFAYWSVECLDCGVEIADDESQDAADRHWNQRNPAAAAQALHDAGPLIMTAEEYNRLCAKINARAKCREIMG